MPLGTREMLLIVRARDEASKTMAMVAGSVSGVDKETQRVVQNMHQAGSTMLAVGTIMAGFGAAGVAIFGHMAKAAADYENQSRLTFTQVDNVAGASLQKIESIGLNVAKTIPVPLNELQGALFDIFSSMDVSIEQSQTILEGFSKAAVAGQVPVRDAARAAIAELNSYADQGYTLDRVLDLQFQLVRKGVGTYSEFAAVLGRVIPAAHATGQTIETMNGFLAFATRNGLSAAMAATGTARAFEALANPIVVKRLHDMGVEVTDTAGNYRQFSDVLVDLGTKLRGMPNSEQVAKIFEIFKGAGGTIQARRILLLAINDFETLKKRVDEQKNSVGALQKAYEEMAKSPTAAGQLISNQFKAIEIELGQALIPTLLQVGKAIEGVLKAFDSLSPHTKAMIAQIGLMLSVFMLVAGVAVTVAGGMLILAAAFGGSIAAAAGLLAVVAAMPAIFYLVVQNIDEISKSFEGVWKAAQNLWEIISSQFGNVREIFRNVGDIIRNVIEIVGELASTFAPIAGIILGLGFIVLINTLRILTGVIADVTKFLADHKEILVGVAVAILTIFVPAIVAAIANLIILKGLNIAIFFYEIVTAAKAAAVEVGLLGVAFAALGFGLGYIITVYKDIDSAQGKYVDKLKGQPKTLDDLGAAHDRLSHQLGIAKDHLKDLNGQGISAIASRWHDLLGQKTEKYSSQVKDLTGALAENKKETDQYNNTISTVHDKVGLTTDQIESMAKALNIDLIHGDFQSNVNKILDAFSDMETKAKTPLPILKELAKGNSEVMKNIADNTQKAMEATEKAFTGFGDVIKSVQETTDAAGNKIPITGQQIIKFYQDTEKATQTFLDNIKELSARGLDPNLISRLLEQGPATAGPIVQAMVSDHSKNLIDEVNKGEAAITELSQKAAEMARLTNLAINDSTSQRTKDLSNAMALDQVYIDKGIAGVRDFAQQHNISIQEAGRVLHEFGVISDDEFNGLVNGFNGVSNSASGTRGQVGALQSQAAQGINMPVDLSGLQALSRQMGITMQDAINFRTYMSTPGSYISGGRVYSPVPTTGGGQIYAASYAQGAIDHFANGGFLAAASGLSAYFAHAPTVLFGERETGGEAFIPLGSHKRTRSTAILGEVARMFGYALVGYNGTIPMQSGGLTTTNTYSSPVGTGGGATFVFHAPLLEFSGPVNQETLPAIEQMVDEKLTELGRMIDQGVGSRSL